MTDSNKEPAIAGYKTYKVPVVKMINTFAYIKCSSAEVARSLIEDKTDVVMISGEVEEVEPFKLGEVGDDKAK